MTIKKEEKVSKEFVTRNKDNQEAIKLFSGYFLKDFIVAFLLGVTCFFLGYISIHNGHTWGGEDSANGDFAQYVSQALAILNNSIDSFVEASQFMRTNSYNGTGPIIYPWGYPILLAIGIWLFGFNIVILKCINLACFSIFVSGFYLICLRSLSRKLSFFASLVLITNPYFLHFHNRLLSDIPFMCIAALGACLMHYYIPMSTYYSGTKHFVMGVLLGVICVVAFLLRSNGIVLPVSLACILILCLLLSISKRIKFSSAWPIFDIFSSISFGTLITPLFIFLMGYILINFYFPNGGLGHPSMMMSVISIKTILGNVFYYFNVFQDFFGSIFGALGMVLAFPFLVYGIYVSIYRQFILLIFCTSVLIVNIIWPFTQGLRFVFVLIPFCIYWTFVGYTMIKLPERVRLICKVLFVSLLLINVYVNLKHEWIPNVKNGRNFDLQTYSESALQMYDFIKDKTKESDIFLFPLPQILYSTTNRLSFYPSDECIKEYKCGFEALQKASYLLLRQEDMGIWSMWQVYFQEIFRTQELVLYRINLGYNIDLLKTK